VDDRSYFIKSNSLESTSVILSVKWSYWIFIIIATTAAVAIVSTVVMMVLLFERPYWIFIAATAAIVPSTIVITTSIIRISTRIITHIYHIPIILEELSFYVSS
jgi:hypothetical protein